MPSLSLSNVAMHYEERGVGPPLVLLHGLGGSGADWAPAMDAFAPRFRTIAPDLRGSGRTADLRSPPAPYTIAGLAADVREALEKLDALPAHLLGWSMGGMVALQLAADAPQLVTSLVIVNSGPDWTPKTPLQRLALRMRGAVTSVIGPGTMARALAPKLFPGRDRLALRRAYVERMKKVDKRAYASLLAAIVGWSVAEKLSSLKMPTLAIASSGDYTSVASKAAWVARMPNARLEVVADSRHALPLEAPERLAAIATEFLTALA